MVKRVSIKSLSRLNMSGKVEGRLRHSPRKSAATLELALTSMRHRRHTHSGIAGIHVDAGHPLQLSSINKRDRPSSNLLAVPIDKTNQAFLGKAVPWRMALAVDCR